MIIRRIFFVFTRNRQFAPLGTRSVAFYNKMDKKQRRVFVCGAGMTKFEKPGRREDFDYPEMAVEAGTKALQDAGIRYGDVQQAVVGYVYGDSTCGQRAVYELGMTGIPVYNVHNNCATGSTALMLAKQLIESGNSDCIMALGFEKMERGSLSSKFMDRTNPLDKHVETMAMAGELTSGPMAAQIFGNAGREHMQKYGTDKEVFAKIAMKNHRHSIKNEKSQFRDDYTLQQIMDSSAVFDPLTKLQCCPTSDGGAAVIVCSEDFVKKRGLENKAVEVLAMEMATDLPSTFNEDSCMKVAGYDMTKHAASLAFRKAGIRPDDVDVVELHDCFSTNELLSYEALGLASEGRGAELVERNDNTYGGKYVVNPSGGLISKGHPLGATGIAQCVELCTQLRGEAGDRQVPDAKLALQHNIGLGGACVVAIYRLGFPKGRLGQFSPNASNSMASIDFGSKAENVFRDIASILEKRGEQVVKSFKGIITFKISDPEGKTRVWYLDLKNGRGSILTGEQDMKADVTVMITDDDLYDLFTNKDQSELMLSKNSVKIQGHSGLAARFKSLWDVLHIDQLRSKL